MRTHKYNFEKYKNNMIANIHQINNDLLSDDILKNSSNNNSMKKSVTLEVNLPIENYLNYNYINNTKKSNNISSRINTNSYDYYSPIIYKSSNDNNYIHYISEINDKNQIKKNPNSNIIINNMNNNHKSSNNINNIRLNNYLKDTNNDSLFAQHQEIKKTKSKQKNKSMNLNFNNNNNTKQRNKSARNNKYYTNNLFNNNYKNTYDENFFENGGDMNNNIYNNKRIKNKLRMISLMRKLILIILISE